MDYSAVDLPEVGRVGVSWVMCRNPMCPNFGIAYDPNNPFKRKNASGDIRYKDRKSEGRFECRYCAQSFSPKSNQAVRPVVRYYLSLSLPFATCPEQTCGVRIPISTRFEALNSVSHPTGSKPRSSCSGSRTRNPLRSSRRTTRLDMVCSNRESSAAVGRGVHTVNVLGWTAQ